MSIEFGTWLGRQLDRREWSQADFAKRVDASTGLVSMWINGKRLPSPKSIQRIVDVFGISPDYVLSRAGHRPADFDDELDELRQDVHAAIDAHPMSERDLKLILSITQQWADERKNATGETPAK